MNQCIDAASEKDRTGRKQLKGFNHPLPKLKHKLAYIEPKMSVFD